MRTVELETLIETNRTREAAQAHTVKELSKENAALATKIQQLKEEVKSSNATTALLLSRDDHEVKAGSSSDNDDDISGIESSSGVSINTSLSDSKN